MKRRVLVVTIAFLNGAITLAGNAQSASQGPEWPASLRTLLRDFTSDSMLQRPIGSTIHARAIELIRTELGALAQRSNGRLTQSIQVVPFETVRPDSARSSIVANGRLAFGIDYVPLSGFGLEPRDVTEVDARFVALGRFGTDVPRDRDAANGRFALMLPPHRPDGEPEYQLNAFSAYLGPFNSAAAVFVTSRDLMPRSVIDRMLRPRLVLREAGRSKGTALSGSPVVIAVTRSIAGHLASGDPQKLGSVRIVFARGTLPHASPNLIAVVPGSDAVLRDEFVVLVAHTDTYYAEAASVAADPVNLLAMAEQLAASEVPLRRSVLFLWTSGYDRGQLGLRYFLNTRASSPTSIAAIVSIDAFGTPMGGQLSGDPYAADGCNSVHAQAATRGIPAVSVRSSADSAFVGRAVLIVQGLANVEVRTKPANAPRSTSCSPF